MSFFGLSFSQTADIDIILDNQDDRKMAELKDENGRKERYFLFYDGESVSGKVNITLHRKTNKLEHQGIKIEFIGQIELYYDRGNHYEFLSLVKDLARPGELTQNHSYDFEFNQVEKPYESYTGANVRLRYFLRVTVIRRLTDMTKEMDLLVHTLASYPEMNDPIKMEVGIEECLHIEFEYNKSKYHLKDVIVGKIYFLLVRIKIKYMEIAIIKKETTGSGPNTFNDNENIAKYEIMDGAPVKGESIPIRVFLAGYDLTPTMREVIKKFSVRYYLNLVLVDEEERRYFKQQEITLWRKDERLRRSHLPSSHSGHQIPHAMARHIPSNDDQAIRTAPTPTTPVEPPLSSLAISSDVEEEIVEADEKKKENGRSSEKTEPTDVGSSEKTEHSGAVKLSGEAEPNSVPESFEKLETNAIDNSFKSNTESPVHSQGEDSDDGKPKPPEDNSVPESYEASADISTDDAL